MKEALSVHVLASGSRGNCSVVSCAGASLVIDAGLSAKEFLCRLSLCGVAAESVAAIVITHEHADHVLGVGPLARRLGIPVYATGGTLAAVSERLNKVESRVLTPGEGVDVAGFRITPVPVTHDAAEPVCFVVETAEGRVALAADLGIATRLVQESLKGVRVLLLEANHDEQMLMEGPYPWPTKQRIKSRHGHLSNESAAALLEELVHDGLQSVALVHLSETNNEMELALATIRKALAAAGRSDIPVAAGLQLQPVAVWPPRSLAQPVS